MRTDLFPKIQSVIQPVERSIAVRRARFLGSVRNVPIPLRKPNYREVVARRLGASKASAVLDAGTGAGAMTKVLSNVSGMSVVSIDANGEVFPPVVEKIGSRRVAFLACDFAHLPFKENVYSGVVCDLVISTSRDWEPLSIFTEFKRVLRNGTSLYITDYYPEKSSVTREAQLAKETSGLYRDVSRAKGVEIQKNVAPESSAKHLRKVGFSAIRKEKIKANETEEWKRRVFEEYFNGTQSEISGLCDSALKARFVKRLKRLKSEIDRNGRIRWDWGVNYLIEATK